MNRTARHLLFIEPSRSEKLSSPVNDELTLIMEELLEKARRDGDRESFYMGVHTTECGVRSESCNYRIKGYLTNSLCAFYLRWYRNSIPERDLEIVRSWCK